VNDAPTPQPAGSLEHASDLVVMISGGFKTTYQALLPDFERQTGACVLTVPGPSMGKTEHAIPQRLAHGEAADVLIMVGPALDKLVAKGETVPGSEVELALSPVGMGVRAGAPMPDISTVEKFRQALLDAKSVAYSDSASGAYVSTELFKQLGIEKEMASKAHEVQATPVGEIVAQGKAEIGFQEVAELLPVKGVTFAGRIPEEVELHTRFAAAVCRRSKDPELAAKLIAFLSAPDALPTLEKMGLEPPKKPAHAGAEKTQ
jgi:molybdate transport system substrate-binding protein